MLSVLSIKVFYYLVLLGMNLIILVVIFYEEMFSEYPRQTEYDLIIVGAGTAGALIFNEVKKSNLSVALIEAGLGVHSLLGIPISTPALHMSRYDWSYFTEPQENSCKAMNHESCRWSAGKGIGGSNILNNLIYSRGHEEDFRGWFSDPQEYNYTKDILPLFNQNEKIFHLNEVSYKSPLGEAIVNLKESNLHFNYVQVTERKGMRWSIAHEIRKELKSNKNIITNAVVTKLLFKDEEIGDKKSFNSVIGVTVRKTGKEINLYAKKGVIISAGTIGSPKILLNSGIGPCEDLKSISIPCRKNLPVGENLQDHILTGIDLLQLNISNGYGLKDLLAPKSFYDFFIHGKGGLSTIGCEAIGFYNENRNYPPELGFILMPVGITIDQGIHLRHILNLNSTIWENYFTKFLYNNTMTLAPVLLHPKSHGYVKLKTNNPDDSPIINPRYLSNSDDVNNLIKGIKIVKNIVELLNENLKTSHVAINEKPLPNCERHKLFSNEYWECYVKHLTFSHYHQVGTCRMGSEMDPKTVVDRNFKVKGFQNLFVVDASVMPNLPSSGTNAVVYMLARKFINKLEKNLTETIKRKEEKSGAKRVITTTNKSEL